MTDPALKEAIRQLYINGETVPDICKKYPYLNKTTVYNWVKKENWDNDKETLISSFTSSPEIMLKSLDTMIKNLGEKVEDPKQVASIADSISKIVKSIKSLYKDKDRYSAIIFVVGELGGFLHENQALYDDTFRVQLINLLQGFKNEMRKKYSPKNFG